MKCHIKIFVNSNKDFDKLMLILNVCFRQIDGKAPSFAQKPIIKQEEDGKKIKFECRILADPKPTISWYRDGASVQSSSRCSVSGSRFWLNISMRYRKTFI